MSIQAMKQALEALEEADIKCNFICYEVKIALRAAITEAERQKPVAWGLQMPNEKQPRQIWTVKDTAFQNATARWPEAYEGAYQVALYTIPQPAIPAGLVIQVIMDAVRCHGSRLNNDEILSMLAAAPKPEKVEQFDGWDGSAALDRRNAK